MSCVLPSVNIACAVKDWFTPEGMEAVDGFTVMDTTDAGVTVRTVEPLIAPDAAVIVDVPAARDAPRPDGVTVAIAGVAELHVTEAERSFCVPSVKFPVALNC